MTAITKRQGQIPTRIIPQTRRNAMCSECHTVDGHFRGCPYEPEPETISEEDVLAYQADMDDERWPDTPLYRHQSNRRPL